MSQLDTAPLRSDIRSQNGTVDLFALGRAATVVRSSLHGSTCVFTRSRRLLGSGVWHGPRDAADSFVEQSDVEPNGGLSACAKAGVRTLLASDVRTARTAFDFGLRCLLRLPYQSGEPATERRERLYVVHEALQKALPNGTIIDGVVPTPVGEALGLDTLVFMATCRTQLSVGHVVADFARLGHRLAQMSLAFGASELFGPIVSERALRLGDNANNPAMTRKEVATFIHGASLTPLERVSGGRVEEVAL